MSVELISVYAVNFRKCRNQSSISFCLAPRQNDKISPIRATSRGPCPLIKTKSTSSLCKAAFCEVKSSKLFLTLLDRVSVPCGLLFCFCCRWNQEGVAYECYVRHALNKVIRTIVMLLTNFDYKLSS